MPYKEPIPLPEGLSKTKFYAKIKPVAVYGEFFRQLVDGRNGLAGKRTANRLVKSGKLNVTMLKAIMWKEYKKGKPIDYKRFVVPDKSIKKLHKFVHDVYSLGA
jgi:hypothetical protein